MISLFEFEPKHASLVQQLAQAPASQKRRDTYESHRHRIFALAFYMTGGEIEAEDMLASTFVRAFAKSDEPSGQQVDRSLVHELREQIAFEAVSDEPLPAVASTTMLQHNVRRPDLEAALGELPATERMVFLLRDVEGQNVERVAGTLELTVPQVNIALLRARLQLRDVLATRA